MAKTLSSKGTLKKQEADRENASSLKKSANSLQSVDKSLSKLTKGISKLNSNVATIKIIEAANMAFDIKAAISAKGKYEDFVKAMERMDANAGEMSARNESGLHDISKQIGRLHSLLAGDTKEEASARQSSIKTGRTASLMKHRSIIAAQADFLERKGVNKVTLLSKPARREHDEEIRGLALEHKLRKGVQDDKGVWLKPRGQEEADEGWKQGRLVGGGFGGGGGGGGEGGMPGGAVSKELFNFVGQIKVNTDKMVWTLIDIVHAVRGDKLKQLEKKREGDKPDTGWKKTSAVAITGGLGIAGAMVGAKTLAEGYAAKKAAQKLLEIKAAKKLKLANIAKDKAAKLAEEKKVKAQEVKDRVERERKANEKKANDQKKKIERQQAIDKKKELNSKAAKQKITKASTKEVGMLKKYFRTFSLKDIKIWLTALKGASTVANAKSVLLNAGIPGIAAFVALAVAQYLLVDQLMQILKEVEKEKDLEAARQAEKMIKDAQKLVGNKSVIQKMPADFNKIKRQQMEANLQKKWGPKFYDYQQYNDVMSNQAGSDWFSQPKYSEQFAAMQATLNKLTIDYAAARAVAEKQLLQNNNINNNSNTTINNFGNTSGQPGAVQ